MDHGLGNGQLAELKGLLQLQVFFMKLGAEPYDL